MSKYLKRCIDETLKAKLASSGAVWIKGPKWCGKSTTAEQFANSVVYMQRSRDREQNVALAKNAPDIFLSGPTPRLIDEWQIIPFIWDDIRYEIDHRDAFGQFILTGSSTPLKKEDLASIHHTGIGRITNLIMRPMSLYESLDSTGVISLQALFENKQVLKGGISSLSLTDYAYLTCRGGWPKSVGLDRKTSLEISKNYFSALIDSDLYEVDGIRKNVEKVHATLKAYTRNLSSQCSIETLIQDIRENDNNSISDTTIVSYLNALRQIYVIEDISAWNPNLRSKTAIRTTPTRHFIDPSIGCRALGLGPNDLINDLKTFGLLFEDLAIRDLKVYAESINGTIYHYRDKTGLEADAILHLENGQWAAFEIKLHDETRIDEGAKHLLELEKRIDTEKQKKPSFLMVITATEYAYQRQDGVWVVPLGCLKN